MPANRLTIGLHACSVVLALAAALACPRPGQAALLVPLGSNGLREAVHWAASHDAALIAIDSANGQATIRLPSNHSLLSALGAGIIPIAARAATCGSKITETRNER